MKCLVAAIGRALKPAQHGADIASDERRIGRIALVGAAPAIILRHGDSRGECPVDPGDADLACGHGADAFDQIGIMRRAERDIVRKQRGADDVGMAVDGIGAPQNRNADAARRPIGRGGPIGIGEAKPVLRGGLVIAARAAVAAIEHRAEVIAAHIVGRGAADVALHQLADLFLQRHARQKLGYVRFCARIAGYGVAVCRPDRRMRGAGRFRLGRLRHGERCEDKRAQAPVGASTGHRGGAAFAKKDAAAVRERRPQGGIST
jgi:hypothetical protein